MLAFSLSVGSKQGFSTSLAEPAMTNRRQETPLTKARQSGGGMGCDLFLSDVRSFLCRMLPILRSPVPVAKRFRLFRAEDLRDRAAYIPG